MSQHVFLTGVAGFIGFHTACKLLARGDSVVGFDVVNAYYDPQLKRDRLAELARLKAETGCDFTFIEADLADRAALDRVFAERPFDRVISLAAQAGVRYSLQNPESYVQSNLVGFANILEVCRHAKVPHLTFASSSSVYGANRKVPFSEHDGVDHPIQLYAATKRSNELMAHAYSHLFDLPVTGLRFFTVYGPWGRPDMAYYSFAEKIMAGEPIALFNYGRHSRDFTYVDDIVEGVVRASDRIAPRNAAFDPVHPDPATSAAPFRIFNIGNGNPVELKRYVEVLEAALGKKAVIELQPMQIGDVEDTFADVDAIKTELGYAPSTSVEAGIGAFVDWYLPYKRRQAG
ncbi:NAD-dependent epimerase [Jiella sp. MQZ9-1]|uniref:NAD-dependent epimerase n=1 Tax=Jiella flava TaxID=2816857 RepID=A0A939G1M6_9HYPH|nr:NAD-dependent epimerase [Jiella flava]MBO0664151.1 NAD-dependent epimerase [Jiella flava]MCD2472723.1 NAD-dependent epimerase [Jiella flava]